MNEQQAIKLLEQATGMLQLKRDDHIQISTALNVLQKAVTELDSIKKSKEAEKPAKKANIDKN